MIIFLFLGIFSIGAAIGAAFFLEPLTASSPTLISGDANFSVAADEDGDFIGKFLRKMCQLSQMRQELLTLGWRNIWGSRAERADKSAQPVLLPRARNFPLPGDSRRLRGTELQA